MSILEVNDVSIRYMTGDFKDIGLKEYVTRKLKGDYHVNEFWADRHVSFTLEKGDMVGIIGTNGAGKSTLLKAVSGIMEPTGGYVKREGNIAALLELASGFDGDLTVRENAYLRGAMLGYTRKFMDEKYEEIIAFAELQDFQDRPFKQLSSGMKSRLAFSIASLVAPDILILDEVLSVGDGAFRKKSEEKMREIIAGGATTILVSHSIQQVREMSNKVLWLHKGEQVEFGTDVQGICDRYEKFLKDGNRVGALKEPLKMERQALEKKIEEEKTEKEEAKEQKGEHKMDEGSRDSECLLGPEYTIKKAIKSIPTTIWTAVLAALIFGFVVHLQSFSGFILNWDTAWASFFNSVYGKYGLLSQGKWLHPILVNFTRTVQIGSANGIAAICYIAVSAGIVSWILRMRDVVFSTLLGMLMVAFPSVMSSFSYTPEELWYFTLLLTVLSVGLTVNFKRGYIGGIIALTLALGYYQAFISVAAAMFVFLCILDLLQNEKSEWEIVKAGFKYMAVLLISILLYYAILQAALHMTGTSLASYRGIDSALSGISLQDLWKCGVESYKKVVYFFWKDAYGRGYPRDVWAYRGVIVLLALIFGIKIKRNRIYQNPLRLGLLSILVFLMPVAIHAIGILGQDANTHWIMIYSFVLIFLFLAKLAESLPEKRKSGVEWMECSVVPTKDILAVTTQWLTIGTLVIVLINWFVITNTGYARLKASFEGAYANNLIIVQEVLKLPEYSPDKPLAVIGTDQTYTGDVFGNTIDRFTGFGRGRDFLIDDKRRTAFIRDFIGIKLSPASPEKSVELSRTDEFKEMPCYPSPGYVKVIDGYLVVKLSDVS